MPVIELDAKDSFLITTSQSVTVSSQTRGTCMGKMNRSEAERLLRTKINSVAGTFLIRESELISREYAVSVHCHDRVRHYRIRTLDDFYFISQRHKFQTLEELVACYRSDAHGLGNILTYPACLIEKPQTAGLSKTLNERWEVEREKIELISRLGAGHFGEVWEAKWNRTTRVAVKTMKEGTMAPEEFLREALELESDSPREPEREKQ